MSYTEITEEGWFSRLGGAIKGVVAGIVMVPVAIVVLWWNEGRAVDRYKTLEEGSKNVVISTPDSVNSGNEGKLVHMSGKTAVDGVIEDKDYGIVQEGVVKMQRNVEYYQVKENVKTRKKKKLGGGEKTVKEYTYSNEWVRDPIDSSKFKESAQKKANKVLTRISDNTWNAPEVKFGAFKLSADQVEKISASEKLVFPEGWELPEAQAEKAKVVGDQIYYGADSANPQIGDVRISYTYAPTGDISILAQQAGDTFTTYQAKKGTLNVLQAGIHSADAMFKAEEAANKNLSWILRAVGAIVMFIGFSMVLKPLSVVLDVIPFLGNVAEMGTGLIAFLLTVVIAPTVIAVAWFAHRPLLSAGLLAVVGGAIFLIMKKRKAKKQLAMA